MFEARTITVHPILEREAELDYLTDALNGANQGNGSLILIIGEAGIGKSSLLR
ncbi:MAG: ATP-binding protein [Mycolicibacterium sp.]|nr:ATP-binding protein [Mycolicibacterium sp.]